MATYLKCIGVWTCGMMHEAPDVREFLERWLAETTEDDWFYNVEYQGKQYFLADNGECGYTAMLPDEY